MRGKIILIIHAILNNEKIFKLLLGENEREAKCFTSSSSSKRVFFLRKNKRKGKDCIKGRKNCENVIHESGLHASNILYMQSPQKKKIACGKKKKIT